MFLLEPFIPFQFRFIGWKMDFDGSDIRKNQQKKQQERNKKMEQKTQEEERLKMVQETD